MLVTNCDVAGTIFELLERLIEKGELHLPDLPPLSVEGGFSWNDPRPTHIQPK